ncbi:Subtilisin Carlsberg precursor [Phycisphaerae bacterium RAS1]|nr:Subtilisin Carlsberg precursor [Phycisphaerae bacterium RAS1]
MLPIFRAFRLLFCATLISALPAIADVGVRIPAEAARRVDALGISPKTAVDYGTFTWLTLDDADYAALAAAGAEVQKFDNPYTLVLGEQAFDPRAGLPPAPEGLAFVRDTGPDLHVVQFVGPTRDEWVDGLKAAGLSVVQYIHPFAYIVWGDAAQLDASACDAAVRWSGDFLPAYRLLPSFRALSDELIDVHVVIAKAAEVGETLAALGSVAGRTEYADIDDFLAVVGVRVAGSSLADIARIPGVYSVQPVATDGGLRGEMSNQVNVNNVDGTNLAFPGYNTWLAGVGLSGAGVIIANVDGGVQSNHPDLVNRLIACAGTTCGGATQSSHGTHTAGIMAADGASGTMSGGFLRGLGMAPGANLVEQLYSPTYQQAGGMLLLMTESYRNGASLSGNSWGPSGSPLGYDNNTRQVDVGVRDADPTAPGNQPLSFVLSFMNGNGGTSTQGTPDEGKNLFSIGSTQMQTSGGVQILQIDDLSSNTAHGPALDGRTIPHLVAPGCYVDSSSTTSTYALLCGTSMASPHVSGAVALFIEYYRGLPDYSVDASPALVKAAFLAVGRNLRGHLDADGGVLGNPFDSKQGWGRMDTEAVVDPVLPVRYFDNPTTFGATGEEWVQTVSGFDPGQPVRIMLVWTDAPGHGLGGSTPAWNNDLDLIVEDGVNTYRGNVFNANGWSTVGGVADTRNNTEGVFIGPTAGGAYTIRVVASNINSDGVPNNADTTDQDFAIVAYNVALEPGFTLGAVPASQSICAPADAVYTVNVGQIQGFTDPVTLSAVGNPAGTTISFGTNPVTPPGSTTMTISNTGAAAAGNYNITLSGVSGLVTRNAAVELKVFSGVPDAPTLVAPADGATLVALRPNFQWNAVSGAATYDIQVARDAGFTNIVVSQTGLTSTNFTPGADLLPGTEYFWHVRASNPCGDGAYSAANGFTTRVVPAILLVDDDDNGPNVRQTYIDALIAAGVDYDIWDTNNTDNEPTAAQLSPYCTVVWFTGDEFGGVCGPGTAGSAALATFLDSGKNLFIVSQDYLYDRGLTTFLSTYLGVSTFTNDVSQTSVTGTGTVFSGLGPYALTYPFTNFSDRMAPAAGAELAFNGNQQGAALNKGTPIYRTIFFGYPFEAIPAASRNAVFQRALQYCRPCNDCNQNGVVDHVDIFNGTSQDSDSNGVPDECQVLLGDMNCDGEVNILDINAFTLAIADPAAYAIAYPGCNIASGDINGDGNVDVLDINPFVELLGG